VFGRITEEDEVHFVRRVTVVLLQVEQALGFDHIDRVWKVVQVVRLVEIAEDHSHVGKDDFLFFAADVELGLEQLQEQLVVDVLVSLFDQPVSEYSARLVRDEFVHDFLLGEGVLARHHDALDHLGHVAEVELVMRLDRGRLESAAALFLDFDAAVHDLGTQLVLVGGQGLDDPAAQDGVEDLAQRFRVGARDVQDLEELREALAEFGPAARGRRRDTHRDNVLDGLGFLRHPVVDLAEADELPDQLDRRLRLELFGLRHVHVVDHHDALVEAGRGPDHVAHADALELVLDLLLRDVGVGLRREVDGDGLELVGRGGDLLHELLAGDRLARAGHAREEHRVHLLDVPLHQLREADRVLGRHHQVELAQVRLLLEPRHDFLPLPEPHLLVLEVRLEVVPVAGHRTHLLFEVLFQHVLEFDFLALVETASEGPDGCEQEQFFDAFHLILVWDIPWFDDFLFVDKIDDVRFLLLEQRMHEVAADLNLLHFRRLDRF